MAYALNRAQVIGNVTRDPEVRQTTSGQTVATFGVATNFSWKDSSGEKKEKVEFHNVVVWGRLAEICGQYVKKGRKIFVEGRMETRQWEGEDGVKRNRTEIVAENVIMLDSKRESGNGEAGVAYAQEKGALKSGKNAEDAEKEAQAAEVSLDDLPF